MMPPPRREPFGTLPDGRPVERWRLSDGRGIEVAVLTLGGILQAARVPDREGHVADVALGFDALEPYLGPGRYFGAVIGRHANRIAGGRFRLDGVEYRLPLNDGANSLHGGTIGFNARLWEAEPIEEPETAGVALSYRSPDGEMGYPGALAVTLRYRLDRGGRLRLDYEATTDRPTVVNLTSHAYWNLAGAGSGTVLDQVAWIAARRFTPVDAAMIPTGELAPVAGTPLDFTTPRPIGARIGAAHPQLRHAEPTRGGYDFNYVLDRPGELSAPAARLADPLSGRMLELYTDEPGLQFYTANHFTGLGGKGGRTYGRWSAFALEAQHFPDSPNRPQFPSTVLRPGQTYRQTTVYRFLAG